MASACRWTAYAIRSDSARSETARASGTPPDSSASNAIAASSRIAIERLGKPEAISSMMRHSANLDRRVQGRRR